MTRLSHLQGPQIWKIAIAGLCGSSAHSLLMYLKWRFGLLPTFQPYDSLQAALSQLTGREIHPVVPWALSFLNGSTIVGLIFGRIYKWLPGSTGAMKGMFFGVLAWAIMGLVFFPMIGLGFFGVSVGLGIAPALFSFAMLQAYSVVLGATYSALKY